MGDTKRKFAAYIGGYISVTECKTGSVTYTFSNGLASKTVNLSILEPNNQGMGYYEFYVPITTPNTALFTPFTIYATQTLNNGTSCNFELYISS
jgi:hypothetical protein